MRSESLAARLRTSRGAVGGWRLAVSCKCAVGLMADVRYMKLN